MPNIKIRNTSPNIIAKNTLVDIKIRNTTPSIGIRSDVVHNRVSTMGSVTTITSGGTTFGGPGYLIGMLGLTYTIPHTTPITTTSTVSDFKPNIRITNNNG